MLSHTTHSKSKIHIPLLPYKNAWRNKEAYLDFSTLHGVAIKSMSPSKNKAWIVCGLNQNEELEPLIYCGLRSSAIILCKWFYHIEAIKNNGTIDRHTFDTTYQVRSSYQRCKKALYEDEFIKDQVYWVIYSGLRSQVPNDMAALLDLDVYCIDPISSLIGLTWINFIAETNYETPSP